jgi:ParB family chromosome partitioning protein
MTSGKFASIPIDAIVIPRAERQRRELTNIPELADSLKRLGQINPITITRANVLITGERRLTAAKQLGWTAIIVQYVEDLDELQLKLIELEENTKRLNLDWKDECAAVAEYHRLQQALNSEWTTAQTADALGMERQAVLQKVGVQKQIEVGNPLVVNAQKFSVARNIIQRQNARARDLVTNAVLDEGRENASHIPLYNDNIETWLTSYSGPGFNFIHCDFPYGINFGNQNGQNSANVERYADSFETYQHLLEDVLPTIPRASSCHLMFWFSMRHFEYTKFQLHQQEWIINPFPLIWVKSDNSGLLPDPKRGGRRTYETAFVASRGDRLIVQPVAMHWHGSAGELTHASSKPRPMLAHFFRMFVDSSTIMLDPTCGSGNAVRVAKEMGAAKVAGVELNADFHGDAVRNWEAA